LGQLVQENVRPLRGDFHLTRTMTGVGIIMVSLFIVFLLRILSYILTLLIALDLSLLDKKSPNRRRLSAYIIGSTATLSFSVYFLLHKILRGRWNFLYTIKAYLSRSLTYQELDYFPTSIFFCMLGAIALGFLVRSLVPVITRNEYGRGYLTNFRKACLFIAFAVSLLAVFVMYDNCFSAVNNIKINEVSPYNRNTSINDAGTVNDYIELYNPGEFPCYIDQLYLSDDTLYLAKKEIPAQIIPAKGYLIVQSDANLLQLRKEGDETIILSDRMGNAIDMVKTIPMDINMSFGRRTDGDSVWVKQSSTPGSTNDFATVYIDTTIDISHEPGFYDAPFYLSMTAAEGCAIYYTLDGSVPTAQSLKYSAPIFVYNRSPEPNTYRGIQNVVSDWKNYTPDSTPVDKAFVIRAIAVDSEGGCSNVMTATYFVELDEYKSRNVISLVVDPDDFWGDDGIYVTGAEYDQWYLSNIFDPEVPSHQQQGAPLPNFYKRGKEAEVDASMELFSVEEIVNENVGVRINGASARNNPYKRLSLYARNEYGGKGVFNTDLINEVLHSSLVLREGYASAVSPIMVENRHIAIQRHEWVSVFINGEFWYDINLLEKYDSQYFQSYYGIQEDNLIVYKSGTMDEGTEADMPLWYWIYIFLNENDMSLDESYLKFGEIVDLQSYVDFMCINIYLDNLDFTESGNIVAWRARDPSVGEFNDGRWRFALYDMDASEWLDAGHYGLNNEAEKNSFSVTPLYTGIPINKLDIYRVLKGNSLFRKQFVLTFMDLVNSNFRYDNVSSIICQYPDESKQKQFLDFFNQRPQYIVPYMAQEFNLLGTLEQLTVQINDENAGLVAVNTIYADFEEGIWNGQYFTDYPCTITAIAKDGYRFVGWRGSVESLDQSIELQLEEGGAKVYAVFEKK